MEERAVDVERNLIAVTMCGQVKRHALASPAIDSQEQRPHASSQRHVQVTTIHDGEAAQHREVNLVAPQAVLEVAAVGSYAALARAHLRGLVI